ncbi:MAG: flavin reductase [Kiritimatiellae bacterium]|nr:flavin reductase [Kiritimatiellia bacterium]
MAGCEMAAFFKIGYGLYVITTHDGARDNGMICNTVVQVTSEPQRIAVTLNKSNYTHDVVRETGKMNVNVLAESAPFSVFQNFGFRSGRDADKFEGVAFTRSENGLAVLSADCNAVFSLTVEQYIDLGTHGLFICAVEEAKSLSDAPTMTYAYYQAKVKPKPQVTAKKRCWVCPICGYVYEGDELPPDFICPLCKHPASEFVLKEG